MGLGRLVNQVVAAAVAVPASPLPAAIIHVGAGDNTAVPEGITTDLDGNGFVGLSDLLALLAAWRPCP